MVGAILQRHGLEKSQNLLVRGRQLCTQLSIIEGSLAELFHFLMLSSSKKIEAVSQNCFVFDPVKCKKLRKCCKIAAFSSLQIDRQIDKQLQLPLHYNYKLQVQLQLHFTTIR